MSLNVSRDPGHPAGDCFDALRALSKADNLTPEQQKVAHDAAHMVNALDVLNYSCLNACKKIGFVYDETQRGGEFQQAFYWLQEKGGEAYQSSIADSKYQLLVGVEQRIEELFRFFQENKNGQS